MKLTQESFDKLVELMNHNITEIKTDIKWLKKGYGVVIGFIGGMLLTLATIAFKL